MTTNVSRPAVERVHPPELVSKIANPLLRRILASPMHRGPGRRLLLLHFTGRRTGRGYTVPVRYHVYQDSLVVVTNSGWRVNFRGGTKCEITFRGARHRVEAWCVEEPEQVADFCLARIEQLGPRNGPGNLGLQVNTGRVPTEAEMREAALVNNLSLIRFQFLDA